MNARWKINGRWTKTRTLLSRKKWALVLIYGNDDPEYTFRFPIPESEW